MDKYEKMNQIKEYISRIEEDLNTSVCSDRETITNKNILQCIKYISELLEETINESSGKISQSGKRFFITEEQRLQLQIIPNATITNIADQINTITENNNTSKITTTWLTDWLISVGILEINDLGQRVPTKLGSERGIISQLLQISYTKIQLVNYYPKDVQNFIYDNIDSVIDFHYNSKQKTSKVKSKNLFFITEEQRSQLQIIPNAMVSEIANELNRVTAENNVKKIQAAWITNWLVSVGFLEINTSSKRVSTDDGKSIGITSKLKNRFDGTEYYQNYYSEKAQEFIYDNIDSIIAFHYGEN